jgi:hypothetical protein
LALRALSAAWRRLRRPREPELRRAFYDRFPAGSALLVHAGFPEQWLGKLLHEPGGGGHFRIDIRKPSFSRPRPPRRPLAVQWLVRSHVLPLGLPLPLLVRVGSDGSLLVRHLRRHGGLCDPAEVGPLYEDMVQRPHYRLFPAGGGFRAAAVLPPEDNALDTPYGLI